MSETPRETARPAGSTITRRRFTKAAAVGAATLPILHPLRFAKGQRPIRIGVLLPRSGHLALIGQACQRGADLAVPILADMGYAVELVNADTESNTDVGRTQAERLIREGVDVLTGAFDSGSTAAIAQVAEQNGVPFLINIAADPSITEQGYRYVFRNFPTAPQLVRNGLAQMNAMFEETGTTPATCVYMHVNDTFGTAMANGIQALAPQVGVPYEVLDVIPYDPQARDLSVEVARARGFNPDFLMVTTRLNDAILLVREMVRQRFEPMGIISPGSPGMYEKQFFTTLGARADYAMTAVMWFDPTQPLTATLEEAFYAAHPDELFEINVGFTFEALQVIADAASRAASFEADDLVEALAATSIAEHPLYGGPIAFDEKGQNNNIGSTLVQNMDGAPVVVSPADIATAQAVFPVPGWNERG